MQLMKSYLTLETVRAERGRRSLSAFIRQAWPIVEPNTEYDHGWHIDALAEHLTAVTDGQIRNLLINMPPRHAKSLIVSVFWPCWVWINKPGIRWLFASYAQTLSTRDSLKCRQLLLSKWYQRNYGYSYKLSADQNAKKFFTNNKGGARLATSVEGSGTGEGGDIIVVDDPHNMKEAYSKTVVESTIRWWRETMSTRGNSPKTSAYVVVGQRASCGDLSDYIIDEGYSDHLCLPAEYEGIRKRTSIGWEDPRTEKGELLWPEHFPQEALDKLKVQLGSYGTASQLQQRPVPAEGGILKIHWWKYYLELPRVFDRVIQSWDTGFKTGRQNDYSVCTTWGTAEGKFYLIDLWKDKVEFPQLKRVAIALAAQHRPHQIIIEDQASGQSLVQELSREERLPIKPIKTDRDKEARAHAVSPEIEAGNVFLPRDATWVQEYVLNLSNFPMAKHDDDVDSTTQALSELILFRRQSARWDPTFTLMDK